MGIYLPNMEMPKDCTECWFRKTARHEYLSDCQICPFTGETTPYTKRKDNCPLVPVPPHGDLIDRDVLRASIRESIEECHKWADEVDKDTMMYARISQSLGTFVECSLRAKAAPTVIPASEEGE